MFRYIEKQVKKGNLSLKTVKTFLITAWNVPNYIVNKYFIAEQSALKYLYSFIPTIAQESFSKSFAVCQSYLKPWNYLSTNHQTALVATYDNLSPEAKAFLVHINKAMPNFVELAGGAMRPSIIKVFMGPLEAAIGDSPTLFSGVMDFTRIFTVQNFIEAEVKVGGRDMKYNVLHLESAKINFVVKLVTIGGKAFISGLDKGGLTNAATAANYLVEVPSKCFTLLAEKRYDLGREDLLPTAFLEQYGKAFWLVEASFGGLSRIYVATVTGEMVAASGFNQLTRDIGNNLELIPIKWALNNETISFNNSDHIGSKYMKCVDVSGGGMIAHAKCSALSVIVIPIDIASRFIPYAAAGFPLMTLTRTTAFIFEKQIRSINGDPESKLGVYEYIYETIVLFAGTKALYNYLDPKNTVRTSIYHYFYPENKENEDNQRIDEKPYPQAEVPGKPSLVLEDSDEF